jgi:hypothetical protein
MVELRLFLLAVKEQWRQLLTGSLLIGLLWFADRVLPFHIPTWIFWIILCLTLFWAFFELWRRTHRKAALYDGLPSRYRDIVDAWTKLDIVYQGWAKQQQHSPPTLPDPMSPSHWGIGDLDFRYRVGVLQGKTNALLDDLVRVGIDVGYTEEAANIRSIPELLRVVGRSKL